MRPGAKKEPPGQKPSGSLAGHGYPEQITQEAAPEGATRATHEQHSTPGRKCQGRTVQKNGQNRGGPKGRGEAPSRRQRALRAPPAGGGRREYAGGRAPRTPQQQRAGAQRSKPRQRGPRATEARREPPPEETPAGGNPAAADRNRPTKKPACTPPHKSAAQAAPGGQAGEPQAPRSPEGGPKLPPRPPEQDDRRTEIKGGRERGSQPDKRRKAPPRPRGARRRTGLAAITPGLAGGKRWPGRYGAGPPRRAQTRPRERLHARGRWLGRAQKRPPPAHRQGDTKTKHWRRPRRAHHRGYGPAAKQGPMRGRVGGYQRPPGPNPPGALSTCCAAAIA